LNQLAISNEDEVSRLTSTAAL